MPIPPFLLAHRYLFLFAGLLVGGETLLLPAIFLGVSGKMHLAAVIAVGLVATLLADFLWYLSGRTVPGSRLLESRFGRRHRARAEALSELFRRQSSWLLPLSKLVYGARIAAQVACGVVEMPWRRYLALNAAGTLGLILLYVGLGLAVRHGVGFLGDLGHPLEISFGLFVLVVLVVSVALSRVVGKRWFRS